MVAYSFKKRFVQPIRVGLSRVSLSFDCPPKRQTIRAYGKRRHARPGERLQLYCGMRTKQCFKIGEAQCTEVRRIIIWPDVMAIMIEGKLLTPHTIEAFAGADGFESPDEMQNFWLENHGAEKFQGVIIRWESL